MVIFIDTSSLAKRYINERGSSDIDSYFQKTNRISISSITPVEIVSVFNRKSREQTISKETFDLAYSNFNIELPHFYSLPFSEKTINSAIDCINKYPIKTLDALQLASAIISHPELFITSDKRLFDFACASLKCECKLI